MEERNGRKQRRQDTEAVEKSKAEHPSRNRREPTKKRREHSMAHTARVAHTAGGDTLHHDKVGCVWVSAGDTGVKPKTTTHRRTK